MSDLARGANRRTMPGMGKVIVKIPHIVWRKGRPRFSPGPQLRALGMAGRDLRHEDGRWFDLPETQAESARIVMQARHLRDVAPRMRAVSAVRDAARGKAAAYAVGHAVTDYVERSPKSRKWSKNTRRGYDLSAAQMAADDPTLWALPLASLTKGQVRRWAHQVERARGLATARASVALLRAALGYAVLDDRIPVNPALSLGLETPEGRIRVGSPEEMRILIAAADETGRPEIGDAIALGLFTGLRQIDRLALRWTSLQDGMLKLRTTKTGARLPLTMAPALLERLSAARARRKVLRLDGPILWDETADAPFQTDWYRHVFAAVRTAAAEKCASLADFRDQDLRDTAVTWLARAGASLTEICSITGHSEKTAQDILSRHYLGEVPERAAAAAAKLGQWVEDQGGL